MVIWCGDNTLSNGNHWWELGFHGSVTTYQEVVKMFLTLGFIQNNFFLLCIERCSVYSLIDVNNNPRMRLIYSKVILIAWKKVGLFLFFPFPCFCVCFYWFHLMLFWLCSFLQVLHDMNFLITLSNNPQRRWYFPKKAENQVWEVWHNENLSQGTNTIGIEMNATTKSVIPW